jgi:hypothetical protein
VYPIVTYVGFGDFVAAALRTDRLGMMLRSDIVASVTISSEVAFSLVAKLICLSFLASVCLDVSGGVNKAPCVALCWCQQRHKAEWTACPERTGDIRGVSLFFHFSGKRALYTFHDHAVKLSMRLIFLNQTGKGEPTKFG